MKWSRQQIEGTATALEALARQLRMLAQDDDVGKPTKAKATPSRKSTPKGKPEFETGQRVRITIVGPYQGKAATIMERRGTMFWYLKVDGVDKWIYKMDSSIESLEN